MTDVYPKPVVAAPARRRVDFGLFSVLDFRETETLPYWQGAGVRWQSFDGGTAAGVLGVIGAPQTGDHATPGISKTFVPSIDDDSAGVFTVYASQKVTPGAWTEEKADARALELLLALEERAVEGVFGGEIGSYPQALSSASTDLGTFDKSRGGLIDFLSTFENWIAEHYGSKGIIHIGRGLATYLLAYDIIVASNRALFTKLGTRVVAGQGYADDAAYATGELVAYRSEVFPTRSTAYELLDKQSNDLYSIAERTYSIGYESATLAAATVTEP